MDNAIFVNSLDEVDLSDVRLPMWSVYNRPVDFPHAVIARLWECGRGLEPLPMNAVIAFHTVADCHRVFSDAGYIWLERNEHDDPKILGTFI